MDGGRNDGTSAAGQVGDRKAAERERLAKALRSNLKRRKAQGRARLIQDADQGRSSSDPE